MCNNNIGHWKSELVISLHICFCFFPLLNLNDTAQALFLPLSFNCFYLTLKYAVYIKRVQNAVWVVINELL